MSGPCVGLCSTGRTSATGQAPAWIFCKIARSRNGSVSCGTARPNFERRGNSSQNKARDWQLWQASSEDKIDGGSLRRHSGSQWKSHWPDINSCICRVGPLGRGDKVFLLWNAGDSS